MGFLGKSSDNLLKFKRNIFGYEPGGRRFESFRARQIKKTAS